METMILVLKQLPPIWPRVAVLALLLALVALPQARRLLTRGGTGSRRMERARTLLEVRKLELEVGALRAAHPELGPSRLDAPIEALLAGDDRAEALEAPLPWTQRMKLAALGTGLFWIAGLLALRVAGERSGLDLLSLALRELTVMVPCALLASALPARVRWGPVLYGILVPLVLVVVALIARP
jgi:hypothetical protein